MRKGEAIRLPHALLLSAAPGVVLSGAITLEGSGLAHLERGDLGADFGQSHDASDGGGGGGGAGGGGAGGGGAGGGALTLTRRGVLSGLRLRHFYDTAITVLGGHWVLEGCVIESSRGEQRACAGVVLRNGARVELRGCTIRGSSR